MNLDKIDIENISLVENKPARDIFCKGWDTAKIVLESIQAMVKNPIVKVILGIVVRVGDSLEEKFCHE